MFAGRQRVRNLTTRRRSWRLVEIGQPRPDEIKRRDSHSPEEPRIQKRIPQTEHVFGNCDNSYLGQRVVPGGRRCLAGSSNLDHWLIKLAGIASNPPAGLPGYERVVVGF